MGHMYFCYICNDSGNFMVYLSDELENKSQYVSQHASIIITVAQFDDCSTLNGNH